MDIQHRIQSCEHLTTADHALAQTILALQDGLSTLSIDDLARASNTSPAAVSRFCKKIGLSGFKDLKLEVARSEVKATDVEAVDVDYPFLADDSPRLIAHSFKSLYNLVVSDALSCLDFAELYKCARLVGCSEHVQIFTHSHNTHVAKTFQERLLRIGLQASVFAAEEEQRIAAAAAGKHGTVAMVISYSGRATFLARVLPILCRQGIPVIFIGSEAGVHLNPGLAHYLRVSDKEDPQERISQFASHIALQYVLDVLYGCVFTLDYDDNVAFLKRTTPCVDDRRFGG